MFLKDTVEIPRTFALACKPLSEVNSIGFSPLYFNATDKIILSGDFLLKSSGKREVSETSSLMILSFESILRFIYLNAFSADFFLQQFLMKPLDNQVHR